MRSTNRALTAVVAATALVAAPQLSAQATPTVQTAQPTLTVIASGLDNPRGLAWSLNHLYLAEAGHGGTDCPAGALGPEGGPLCVGRTGSLDIVAKGTTTKILHNLISISDIPGGLAATGIAAVASTKLGVRMVYNESVTGLLTSLPKGTSLTAEDSASARSHLGRLATLTPHLYENLADVGDADFTWSAVHQDLAAEQFPDADPNGLVVLTNNTYVVDAASNTLDAVSDNGSVRQLAFIPNEGASNSVPTCVAIGPDHNLYIGELAPGAAHNAGKVYRYNVNNGHLSVWKTGFNVVDGCGFDSRGNFYAVEFQANGFNPGPTGNPAGDIVKIAHDGTRTVIGAGKLFYPIGFAADHNGNIYVSNWSILTAIPATPTTPTGQVVKISF